MGFPLLLVTEERLRLPSEELEIEYSQATGNWTPNTRNKPIGEEMPTGGLTTVANGVLAEICPKNYFYIARFCQKDAKIATIGQNNCKQKREP